MTTFNRAAASLLAILLPAAGPALAAEPTRLRAAYDVAWLGMTVAVIEVEAELAEASYRIGVSGESMGVLALFTDFRSQSRAAGALAATERVVPESYLQSSSWNGAPRQVALGFAPDGSLTRNEITAPPDDDGDGEPEREPVPPALQVGPDPLSLVLQAALGAAPGAAISGRTFDGRRVVELGLACGTAETIEPSAAAPAVLSALPCTVASRVVAGGMKQPRPRRLQLEGEPMVWLSDRLVPGIALPLRLEATTSLGTVTAELIRLGTPPAG